MKTAFLIINYNDAKTTLTLLNNIKNYKIIDKILIVDNNSTDNSFKILKEYENDKIEIVKTKVNKGYGAGINFGAKYLTSKLGRCYIIVSNSDIIIEEEKDIKDLINTFDQDTAIVAPIIKEHGNLNRGWKTPTPLKDTLLNLPLIHRWLRPKLLGYKKYQNITFVEVVSGCFFIIDSDCLEKANYYDENVFLYYEENIMARKLQKLNKKTLLNNKVSVIHNHSVTIDKNIKRIKKYKTLKQSQMYFHKVYNKANILERFLLFLTNKLTLLLIYISSIFRK